MSHTEAREEKLKRVQQLGFMVYDLMLFLDTHPRSTEALSTLQCYLALERSARQEYEQAYGPLTAAAVERRCRYDWVDPPWPWELEA